MWNFILKNLKKKRNDIFGIAIFSVLLISSVIILPKISLFQIDTKSGTNVTPIEATVTKVTQDIQIEKDVNNNEIELIYDTIEFYIPKYDQYQEITLSHLTEDYRLKKGDRILVYTFDGVTYHYHDINRIYYMKSLVILFVVLVILIGGILGIKSILSLCFSIVLLLFGLIPLLEEGIDPILSISIIGFIILCSSLFFLYGFRKRSVIALIGTTLGLLLALLLSFLYTNALRLTGIHDEIDSFLLSYTKGDFDMKNLLIGSFLLGTIGVIDDVTISQIMTVEQIYKNASKTSFKKLFASAMNVGRSHIASMVNTLFLAYFSVSLSFILVVLIQNWDTALLLNRRFITTEIIRTLIGSIGLVASVPITTFLACLVQKKVKVQDTLVYLKSRISNKKAK